MPKRVLDQIKEIIKLNFKDYNCGLFFSHNLLGDTMRTIWRHDGISVDVCDDYAYFEVLGLPEDQQEELLNYYRELGRTRL